MLLWSISLQVDIGMCGRFLTRWTWPELWALYHLDGPLPDKTLTPRYNIAPGQPVVAVCREVPAGEREILPLVWGLVPAWTRKVSLEAQMFNARAETVAEKPSFRNALRRRRCLIPASGYYEWRRASSGSRQAYLVRAGSGEPLSLAGIWEKWIGANGSEIWSCAILTTKASSYLAQVNDRMPVVLPPEVHDTWLDPPEKPARLVLPLLQPADGLEAVPVGPAVNDARYQGPECAEPAGDVLPVLS